MRRTALISRSWPARPCRNIVLASLLAALVLLLSGCSRSKSGGTESETKASSATGSAELTGTGAGPTKVTVAAIAIVGGVAFVVLRAMGMI